MSEALLSNTGGVATLIGDPPNVLIGTAAGLSFVDFLTHAFPVAIVAWLAALGALLWLFRRDLTEVGLDAEALDRLRPEDAWRDRAAARKVLIAMGVALVLFLLQEWLGVGSAFIAFATSAAALVWVRPPPRAVLQRVEWSVLVFFASLFVLVGGLEAAGLMDLLSGLVLRTGQAHPVVTAVSLVWVVGLLSAVIDNVPITVALIPVIQQLGQNGVAVNPLWWAPASAATPPSLAPRRTSSSPSSRSKHASPSRRACGTGEGCP